MTEALSWSHGRRKFYELADIPANEKRGKRAPTGRAVLGHSVVYAWARAVERAGTFDSDAVLAKLEKFSDEPLLAGLTTYTPEFHTNFLRPMLIFSFENGKLGPLGYYDPRSGDYVQWWGE